MVSSRGLSSGAALVGTGAVGGPAAGAETAATDTPLDTPFTPAALPHLAEAEQLVRYQRMLAAGHLPTGLAGHWPLDGSGTDRSGLEHPVTLGSGAGWTTLRTGGELSFDGTSGAYAATGSVLDTTAPFTVAAWVRLADDAVLTNMYTAVSQDGDRVSRFLLQYDDVAGTWAFKVRSEDQGAKISALAATPVTRTGVWTHLTGVWDGSRVQLYVNGVLEGSADTTLSWAAPQGFSIGRARWDGGYVNRFKGAIDDVRAYGRALSAAEVALVSGATARANNVYLTNAAATVGWGRPDDLASWVARARCASFVTALLRHTYGWATDAYFLQHFRQRGPEAASYCAAFLTDTGGPRFRPVRKVTDLRPGDLIAVDYNGQDTESTGHIVVVRAVKGVFSGVADFPGETQYAVEIIDCTSDPHGVYGLSNYPRYPDTRMVSNVDGENFQGVGIGHMMFYAADATGAFSRYRWSVNSSASTGTHPVTYRPVAAARIV
ncbi:LamG domain-containing protein [Streptomyces sp. NPDC007157]|uniref:LamG domain-containing protein n=1 Tax=Streptomyces sp. NPDC007157 TaxID=3154681 RepID=UPI0033EABBF1